MIATDISAAALVNAILAVSEAIREVGSIPSGYLYAHVMDHMNLGQYERILEILKGAGLVREDASHLLTWIGPTLKDSRSQ